MPATATRFFCPFCGQTGATEQRVPDGARISCPECHNRFTHGVERPLALKARAVPAARIQLEQPAARIPAIVLAAERPAAPKPPAIPLRYNWWPIRIFLALVVLVIGYCYVSANRYASEYDREIMAEYNETLRSFQVAAYAKG